MAIDVVRIEAGNVRLLGRIADDVFDNEINSARLATYCAMPDAIFHIAMDGDLVVGQARGFVHRHPDAADEFYIDNLGVAPGYRRRGIATQLMRALLDEATSRGCVDIWLSTEPYNDEALGFYRSLGLNETPMTLFANFDESG